MARIPVLVRRVKLSSTQNTQSETTRRHGLLRGLLARRPQAVAGVKVFGGARVSGGFKDAAQRIRTLRRRRLDALEESLEEQPLHSAGAVGPLALGKGRSGWRLALNDGARRSFVSWQRGGFSDKTLRDWFKKLEAKIPWEQPCVGERKMPRSAAWLTSNGCRCNYSYGGCQFPASPMQHWFLEITEAVCNACGIRQLPNSCNANYYKDGSQSVGWHADDEPLFNAVYQDALIISLSLGESRSFELRPKNSVNKTIRLRLLDGDICTMEGLMQKHYLHRVPIERRSMAPRINLTWRWVVAHEFGCPRVNDSPSVAAPLVMKRVWNEAPHEVREASLPIAAEEAEKRRKRALRFSSSPTTPSKPAMTVVDFENWHKQPEVETEDADVLKRRVIRFASASEKVTPEVLRGEASADSTVVACAEKQAEVPAEARSVNGPDMIASLQVPDVEKRRQRALRFGLPAQAASSTAEAPGLVEPKAAAAATAAASAAAHAAAAVDRGIKRPRPAELIMIQEQTSEAEKRLARKARFGM